jgi:hypothetical protein
VKKKNFTAENVIQKLVNYYGLPAFLFKINDENGFTLIADAKKIKIHLVKYNTYNAFASLKINAKNLYIFEDLWHTHEEIIASKINWHAGLHEKINARKCSVINIGEGDAILFMNRNHLMNHANAKYYYALIHEKQILAVAGFSHGRKMNRLPEGKLGYELVRFATIPNVSITGGLSKLISKFAGEYEPGDIMTYVDPLNGEILGLTKVGFKQTENTKPILLHVNTQTHERVHANKNKDENVFDFYNLGNIKLVKTF